MKKTLLTGILALTGFMLFAQAPTDGLVVHYKFNGDLNDYSGNNHHAEAQQSTEVFEPVSGMPGEYALRTLPSNGVKTYYGDDNDASRFHSQNFTYSTWFKMDAIFETGYLSLIENGIASGNQTFQRMRRSNTSFLMEFGYYYDEDDYEIIIEALNLILYPVDTWHLYTVTCQYDATTRERTYNYYLDKILIKTFEFEDVDPIPYDESASAGYLAVGGRINSSSMGFKGAVKDTYIYDRVLSLEEVQAIYEVYEGVISKYYVFDNEQINCGEVYQWRDFEGFATSVTNVRELVEGGDAVDTMFVLNLVVGYNPTITYDGGVLSVPDEFEEYQWYKDGEEIQGANGPTYATTEEGVYYVYVKYQDCDGNSISYTIEVVTAIENEFKELIHLYPNPSSGILNLTLSSSDDATFVITDMQGRVLQSGVINTVNSTFDVSSFASNIYFLNVEQNGKTATLKFIKE